ncbi:MAG: HEPN domain-containing protein [Promethearchaeota archaeon]
MNFDDVEYERWMKQAKNTLEGAQKDLDTEQYNWSCFKSHQAAEFSLKAILYGFGATPFGHSLIKLLNSLTQLKSIDISPIKSHANTLDRHYIPSRYANSYASGSPYEYYDSQTATDAIKCAEKIVNFVEQLKP